MIIIPFKTIPKIINKRANIDELYGKEFLAHLMMKYDLASDIDKYKFVIDSDIYNKLLFEKLRSMPRAEGWKWKKAVKIKLDKYDKLIEEIKPMIAIELCISLKEFEDIKMLIREFADDMKFRKHLVDIYIAINDIQDTKKKDKLYKKYDIKQEQQSLF